MPYVLGLDSALWEVLGDILTGFILWLEIVYFIIATNEDTDTVKSI